MNVVDAAYHTVHAYPGGSESLGPRVGISPAVLRNKVNPHNTTHHLTLAEADRLLGVTGDHQLLHALAAAHGYGLHRLTDEPAADILGQLLRTNAANGEFAQALQAALGDGVVTENEYQALATAGASVSACMVLLLNKLRAAAHAHRSGADA